MRYTQLVLQHNHWFADVPNFSTPPLDCFHLLPREVVRKERSAQSNQIHKMTHRDHRTLQNSSNNMLRRQSLQPQLALSHSLSPCTTTLPSTLAVQRHFSVTLLQKTGEHPHTRGRCRLCFSEQPRAERSISKSPKAGCALANQVCAPG